MYRVYLRWANQRVSEKICTLNPIEAENAFRALLGRRELVGQKVAAVLSLNNRQLEYCRFDYPPDSAQWLKPLDAEIRLFHS